MSSQDIKSFFNSQATQVTLKLALIGILVLILLIPRFMILDLIKERQHLSENVKYEVTTVGVQIRHLQEPLLIIPYDYKTNSNEDKEITQKKNLVVFPDSMNINGNITTESKHRSIYPVLLYRFNSTINGKFKLPDYEKTNISPDALRLNEAYIATGISDIKGISDKITINWNNNAIGFSPGLNNMKISYQIPQQNYDMSYNAPVQPTDFNQSKPIEGIHSKINLDKSISEYDFSFNFNIKGYQKLYFCPVAKTTDVHIASTFSDPSFIGNYLPDNKVDNSGFEANWKILEYNKSLPEFIKTDDMVDLGDNLFGLTIDYPIDNYSKSYRTGRYMILIITLTFLIVFLTEIVQKIKIHIFQYLLIGLALAIFFTLQLSISEFLGFDISYLIAASATIILLFLYSLQIFDSKKSSLILLALLTSLFIYIYIIIQMEKTALLAGSIGLFGVIAATMYVTRKIKWTESIR
ncbi:MAG: cell envelope integrity protein CreD [Saprospiraceae bacterium]